MILKFGISLFGLLTPSRLDICDPSATSETTTALDGPDVPYRICIVIWVFSSSRRLHLLHNCFCFSFRVYTSCMLFSHRFCLSFFFAGCNCYMIFFRIVMYALYVISWKSYDSRHHYCSRLQLSVTTSTIVHPHFAESAPIEALKRIMAWRSFGMR